MKKNKKYLGLCICILLLIPISMIAQTGTGIDASLTAATTALKTTSGNVISLMSIVLGIGAVVSIVLVFYKASKGDQDASNKAQSFFFALLFATVALLIVQKLWLAS